MTLATYGRSAAQVSVPFRAVHGIRAMRRPRVPLRRVALAGFAVLLAVKVWLATPFYNWDMIGYAGVVIGFTESSPAVLHARTFGSVRAHVPAETYEELTTANSYEIAMAADPDDFVEQLPYYRVKPLYPAMMLLLYRAGLDLVAASVVIAKLASFAVGLLIFHWVARRQSVVASFVLTGSIVSLYYVSDLARYSTPDAVSVLIVLSSFYLMIERRAFRGALALLVLAITARPDNLLLLLAVVPYIAIYERRWAPWAWAACIAGGTVYLLETRLGGHAGWTTLFYHSFVHPVRSPSGFVSPLGLVDYLRVYLTRANPRVQQSVVMFAFLHIVALLLCRASTAATRLWFRLLVVNAVFMVAHWLAFPGEKERLFAAPYLLILMALVNICGLLRADDGPAEAPSTWIAPYHAKAGREQ